MPYFLQVKEGCKLLKVTCRVVIYYMNGYPGMICDMILQWNLLKDNE